MRNVENPENKIMKKLFFILTLIILIPLVYAKNPNSGFNITVNITSYPDNVSQLSFPINFTIFNNGSKINLDVGAWVEGITSEHWPENHQNLSFSEKETKEFNYIINLTEIPCICSKELKTGIRFENNHSKRVLASVKVNLTKIFAKVKMDLETSSITNLTLGDFLKINISLENPDDEVYNGNFSLKIKRKASEWKDFLILNESSLSLNPNETKILKFTWKIPNETISGKYKIYAKFEYLFNKKKTYTSKSKEFNISGLKDLGEWNFSLISLPNSLKFGGFGNVLVKFYSGNYNYQKLKFIAYFYNPKYIAIDLEGNTIYKKFFEVNTGIEIENVKRGEEYYLSLPIFLKRNCENDYKEGLYKGKVRVYFWDKEWKELENLNFKVLVSGKNEELCEKKIIYKTKYKSSETKYKKEQPYKILEYPKEIEIDKEFIVKVEIKNTGNYKNFSVYSYVYSGKKCVSSKGWTGNKKVLEIKPGHSKIIELKNKIKNETEPGNYSLRVRIRFGNKKFDITKNVKIVKKKEMPKIDIKENNGSLKITTNCKGCKIIIFTPKNEIEYEKKEIVFKPNESGKYYFLLIKNSEIVERKEYEKKPIKEIGLKEIKTKKKGNLTTTGYITKNFNQKVYEILKRIFQFFSFF